MSVLPRWQVSRSGPAIPVVAGRWFGLACEDAAVRGQAVRSRLLNLRIIATRVPVLHLDAAIDRREIYTGRAAT